MRVVVTDEEHTAPARLGVILLAETVRDDVFEKDDHFAIRVEHLDARRILHRVGAADPRTVIRRARDFHALNHDDLLHRRDPLRSVQENFFQLLLSHDARVFADPIFGAAMLLPAARHNRHAVFHVCQYRLGESFGPRRDHGFKCAHVPAMLDNLAASENVNAVIADDAVDEVAHQALRVAAFRRKEEIIEIAAQHIAAFNQGHFVTGIRNRKCGSHSGDAAPDNERALIRHEGLLVRRRQCGRARGRHADQLFRLARRAHGIVAMHPRTLLADIRHFEHIGIESGFADDALEQRFVRTVRARRDHHTIDPTLFDGIAQVRLTFRQTQIRNLFGVDDSGQIPGISGERIGVDSSRDCVAARANKNADAGHFFRGIAFRRKFAVAGEERILAAVPRAPEFRGKQAHHFGRRAAGINQRLGDLFRRLECAAHENAGAIGLERREFVGLAKAIRVEVDAHALGERGGLRRRLHADREHHHVVSFLLQFAVGRHVSRDQVVGCGVFLETRNTAARKANFVLLTRLIEISVVFFVERALVHDKDAALDARQALLGENRFLGRVHAANGRTVGMVLIA